MNKTFRKLIALSTLAIFLLAPIAAMAADGAVTCWFSPAWKAKGNSARAITEALSAKAGIDIKPRIANSYPEILEAFSSDDPALVYVGSFVQAVINARGLGTPLVQTKNGKEMYSGVLVYPRGEDPATILVNFPEQIAFAFGASSGESSAKAATGGKAAIGVASHGAASQATVEGKAKAAVVKNWWWESNQAKFPTLAVYEIPGISLQKNPDNVLTASKAIPADMQKKITMAALGSKMVFGAASMAPFEAESLSFSLELMKKGNIDPLTYSW